MMTTPVELSRDIERLTPGLIELRRTLHRHPELAFEEVWTTSTLAGRMRDLGLAVQEGIGGSGVLAVLGGHAAEDPAHSLGHRRPADGRRHRPRVRLAAAEPQPCLRP